MYLKIKKVRLNIIRVDPMIAEHKRYDKVKKRMQKQMVKKEENIKKS
jgi:hypothetical protein